MKRGSGGTSPPEANGMKRSQIKWKLLLFDESEVFSFEASLFLFFLFSSNRAMLFILLQIKKRVFLFKPNQIIKWSGLKRTYNLCIFAAIVGVWGAISNKMRASQETCFLGKNNPSLPPDIKRYVPKKKASIQAYLIFLKGYVEKLERNYIDIWGSGGESPQKPATFQRIR